MGTILPPKTVKVAYSTSKTPDGSRAEEEQQQEQADQEGQVAAGTAELPGATNRIPVSAGPANRLDRKLGCWRSSLASLFDAPCARSGPFAEVQPQELRLRAQPAQSQRLRPCYAMYDRGQAHLLRVVLTAFDTSPWMRLSGSMALTSDCSSRLKSFSASRRRSIESDRPEASPCRVTMASRTATVFFWPPEDLARHFAFIQRPAARPRTAGPRRT